MRFFDWRPEESEVLGEIFRPVARIGIRTIKSDWKFLRTYIDSGADISVIQRSFGELLGLDVENGKYAIFEGAGGGKLETYIHNIEMKIGDEVFKTKVAFCKDPLSQTPNLLGRETIFDLFEIHFKNIDKKTGFVRTVE